MRPSGARAFRLALRSGVAFEPRRVAA